MNIINDDCLHAMAAMNENSIDTIITDPPYGLSFMGKGWDHGVPGVDYWAAALRVAKPGAMLLAFGGTRTFHRLSCAIEDAGWEIRDCLMWLYGSGFPKSVNLSKAVDKVGGEDISWFSQWLRQTREAAGISRDDLARHFLSKSGGKTGCVWNWEAGIRTPSARQFNKLCKLLGHPEVKIAEVEREFIAIRKGVTKTYNVGASEIVGNRQPITAAATDLAKLWDGSGTALKPAWEPILLAMKPCGGTFVNNATKHGVAGLNIDGCRIEGGRWPANVILDEQAGELLGETSRFFYCAKASKKERGEGNTHPTVKPLELMRYLVRLTKTPTGGIVLDPFAGSGTTGLACDAEGRDCILIEQDAAYCDIMRRRAA